MIMDGKTDRDGPWIGVDIGGTKVAAGLVDRSGVVVERDDVVTPRTGSADVLATVQALIGRWLPAGAVGVGVGAPGAIDSTRGAVVFASDILPGWAGADVAGPLSATTGLPVVVLNDVDAAAVGEARRGAGIGYRRLLVVSVGTGIGGSLVDDGTPQQGAHGTTGEIAHLLAPDDGPIPCGCGRFDHIESWVSGPAMVAAYRGNVGFVDGHMTLSDIVRRWRGGDRAAADAVTSAAALGGRAIAGLAGAIDVDAVIVTGGVALIGEPFIAPLRSAFRGSVIAPLRDVPLLAGSLGRDAPLIGAAAESARQAALGTRDRCSAIDRSAGR